MQLAGACACCRTPGVRNFACINANAVGGMGMRGSKRDAERVRDNSFLRSMLLSLSAPSYSDLRRSFHCMHWLVVMIRGPRASEDGMRISRADSPVGDIIAASKLKPRRVEPTAEQSEADGADRQIAKTAPLESLWLFRGPKARKGKARQGNGQGKAKRQPSCLSLPIHVASSRATAPSGPDDAAGAAPTRKDFTSSSLHFLKAPKTGQRTPAAQGSRVQSVAEHAISPRTFSRNGISETLTSICRAAPRCWSPLVLSSRFRMLFPPLGLRYGHHHCQSSLREASFSSAPPCRHRVSSLPPTCRILLSAPCDRTRA